MGRSYDAARPALLALLLGTVVSAVGGCGGPKTYAVQGKVIYKDGTPLTDGQVVFEPVDPTVKVSARGDIKPDGTFRLTTYKDGDGAVEGKYRAVVLPPWPPEVYENRPAPPPVIDPRFQEFERSGLEFTVTPGKNNFTLVVEKPAGPGRRRP